MQTDLKILPLVPLRDVVVFPNTTVPLYVGRDKSLRAIENSQKMNSEILLVAQRNPHTGEPGPSDFFDVATKAIVKQYAKLSDGNVKILVEAQEVVRISGFAFQEPFFMARYEPIPHDRTTAEVEKKWMANLLSHVESYFKSVSRSFGELSETLRSISDPHELVNIIASQISLKLKDRQSLLEQTDPVARIELLSTLILSEIELLKLDRKIKDQVREKMEKSQKEYFLNEQISAIQKELGTDGDLKEEIKNLEKRLSEKDLPDFARDRATKELKRLKMMGASSPETGVIRSYVELILDLPWNDFSTEEKDLATAEKILNRDHFGLKEIKERILEFLAVWIQTKNHRSPIICFLGPPGVGKTSLAKSIATSLGRKFERISLGGLRDEAELRGHRRTYIAALPGKILAAMKKAGTNNPVILLDEIDKIGMDYRGDPSSVLLEILDPEQNKHFTDHYLDLEFDLSKVLFVATANIIDPLSPPLRDRLEVISLSGYSEDEKISIAKEYIIPREATNHGLKPEELSLDDSLLSFVIQKYTREAGVRGLQKEIAKIARKLVKKSVGDKSESLPTLSESTIESFLGVPRFKANSFGNQPEIGVVTGLAWTSHGGELLTVEANVLPGRGKIQITGQLGNVMQESVKAALSYIRSRAHQFGLDEDYFSTKDIHIHVPEGAIPKDGPSAGITMATAILSAILKVPIKKDIGMTGEITLRGRVLPIGGLKEKLLAAQRGQLKEIYYPIENEKDRSEIPTSITDSLRLIPIYQMDEIIEALFAGRVNLKKDSLGLYIDKQGVRSTLGPSGPLL